MTNQQTTNKKSKIGLAVGAVLAAVVAGGIWLAMNPAPEPIYGMVQAKTVDVASKVTGRVESFNVREGDMVEMGQTVALMNIPEVEAKLKEVQALEAAASAKAGLVEEGARPQEKRAAQAQYEQASAGEELARKTFNRVKALYKDGLISRQKYDEAYAQYQSAKQLQTMAKEKMSIAETGARAGEKEAALALSQRAKEGVAQVASLAAEKTVITPIAGEVSRLYLEKGEIAAAGFPIATIVDLNDQWVTFNVREDELTRMGKGAVVKAMIPALGKGHYTFKVYFVNPRGDYATWRSTRATTGYDLKTFEVRARSDKPITGLRPGMSVVIER